MGKPRNCQSSDLLGVYFVTIEAGNDGGCNITFPTFPTSIFGVRQHGIHNFAYLDRMFLVLKGVLPGFGEIINYPLGTSCEFVERLHAFHVFLDILLETRFCEVFDRCFRGNRGNTVQGICSMLGHYSSWFRMTLLTK